MKKILSAAVILACLCSLLVMPAHAAYTGQDPVATTLRDSLRLLDCFYEYDYNYMIRVATDTFHSSDNMDPVSVSAGEFDAVLRKFFVITDSQIQELREFGNRDYNTTIYDEETWQPIKTIPFYDAETQTYTFRYYGGFGGSLPDREYLGYVKNGQTYDVYYRHLTYSFLHSVLPEGTSEQDVVGDEWPMTVEYKGVTYMSGPDGYYTILSYDNYGRKYTVEMNGDVVRIISCVDYTEGQQPDTFDDKIVHYEIPENSGVTIPDNDCFPGNTTVKVEPIVSGSTYQKVADAVRDVADQFVAYEFTASRENEAQQPNGKLAVTFAVPRDYSENVKVYYMRADGALEEQESTFNAQNWTVTAQLDHFSTYILVEVKQVTVPDPTEPDPTEPDPTGSDGTEPSAEDPTQAPTTNEENKPEKGGMIVYGVIGVLVLAALAAVILAVKKKKNV